MNVNIKKVEILIFSKEPEEVNTKINIEIMKYAKVMKYSGSKLPENNKNSGETK